MLGWSVALLVIGGLLVLRWMRIIGKEKRKVAPLKAFAAENNAQLSAMDSWYNSLIGVDSKVPGTLFFIRNVPGREVREKIDLREVSACWMFKDARTVDYKKEKVNVIDRIEIIISFIKGRPLLALEFYNNDYDSLTLTGELQLAQKWTGVINNLVSADRKRRAAERKREPVVASIPVPSVKPGVFPGKRKGKRPLVGGRAA